MRYRLRTLLILLAVGPPVLGGAWLVGRNAIEENRAMADRARRQPVVKGPGFQPGRAIIQSEQ